MSDPDLVKKEEWMRDTVYVLEKVLRLYFESGKKQGIENDLRILSFGVDGPKGEWEVKEKHRVDYSIVVKKYKNVTWL